ncbi:hypothetical protein ACLB2K_050752 [Fragaria x ananassa]
MPYRPEKKPSGCGCGCGSRVKENRILLCVIALGKPDVDEYLVEAVKVEVDGGGWRWKDGSRGPGYVSCG